MKRLVCASLIVALCAGLTLAGRAWSQETREPKPAIKGLPRATESAASPAKAEVPPSKAAAGDPKPVHPATKPATSETPKGDGAKRPADRPVDTSKGKPLDRSDIALTAGREAAALTFARIHHPELSELLERLRNGNRVEYERAVKDLFQASEKLARVKERSPDRYEPALQLWKLNSRIRLLVARMTMTSDPALEGELAGLLKERAELRTSELRAEREKAASRVERLDEEIARIERDGEATLERELQQVRAHLTEQTKLKKTTPRKGLDK